MDQEEVTILANSSVQFYVRLILLFVIICGIINYCTKAKRKDESDSANQRLWKKFLFSYQDLFTTFSHSDTALVRQTFSNTLKNIKIENDNIPRNNSLKKREKKIEFNLSRNEVHMVPYYIKNIEN